MRGKRAILNFEGTFIVDRNSFMMGDFFPRLMANVASRERRRFLPFGSLVAKLDVSDVT